MPDSKSDGPAPEKRPPLHRRVVRLVREDAWSLESLADKSALGRLHALVRVAGITIKGVGLNKIPQQAAALTYYTLMSLGPIFALTLTISAGILEKQENGRELLKAKTTDLIQAIAPQTVGPGAPKRNEKSSPAETPAASPPVSEEAAREEKRAETIARAKELKDINPDLDGLVDKLIENSASGGATLVGTGILLFLAVMMLTRVENAFNSIWGVTKGRPWKDRVVNYVLFLLLTSLLGAASLTMLSIGAIAKAFGDVAPGWLAGAPGAETVLHFFRGYGPTLISAGLLTVLIATLIKHMPYAKIPWRPALGGAVFVTVALLANQKLGVLYAKKVSELQSLYGGMSIVLVLMFGMYLSWLFLLVGGQIAFAIQYVRRLAAYRTWESLSSRTRSTLCFGCLIHIGRRFRSLGAAPDGEEMAASLRVPRALVDECLSKLLALRLIVAIDDGDDKPENDRFRPDFPLGALTVGEIRDRLDTYNTARRIDPEFAFDKGLVRYTESFAGFAGHDSSRQSFDSLLGETEEG